jgi:hypothetical protein
VRAGSDLIRGEAGDAGVGGMGTVGFWRVGGKLRRGGGSGRFGVEGFLRGVEEIAVGLKHGGVLVEQVEGGGGEPEFHIGGGGGVVHEFAQLFDGGFPLFQQVVLRGEIGDGGAWSGGVLSGGVEEGEEEKEAEKVDFHGGEVTGDAAGLGFYQSGNGGDQASIDCMGVSWVRRTSS